MIAESRMKTVAEGRKQKANYRFAILDLSINSATGWNLHLKEMGDVPSLNEDKR
jgi:hypothetical protein